MEVQTSESTHDDWARGGGRAVWRTEGIANG